MALGCAPEDEGPSRDGVSTGHAVSPIEGGTVDDETTAVVGVRDGAKGTLCTGTLVAPNLVLTALHCVAETSQPTGGTELSYCEVTQVGATTSPDELAVTTATSIDQAPEHGVVGVLTTPEGESALCGRDLALLILASPLPPEEASPMTPRVDGSLEVGQLYSAFGFGGTEEAGAGLGVRRRRDGLSIACVGEACPDTSFVPEVAWNEWLGQNGICPGDSGGPAVDEAGQVIGVASRGAQGCSDPVYGSTIAWSGWLMEGAAYASGLGELPLPAWAEGATLDPAFVAPVGGLCASGADCYTGTCLKDDAGHYCSRPCDEAYTCPPAYVCVTQSGLCERAIRPADDGCSAAPGRPRAPSDGALLLWALTGVWAVRRRALLTRPGCTL